ncbi:MAG: 4'-phosphopantetheinyl transferase superfamily protein, partial [bacterium]
HPAFGSPFPPEIAYCWCAGDQAGAATLLPAEASLLTPGASSKRRREFALGRYCARTALRRLKRTAGDGRAREGEGGAEDSTKDREQALRGRDEAAEPAPILRGKGRAPLWPEGVVGSITHSGGMAAAAVADAHRYAGIGLDLERVGRSSGRLMNRILRPEERATLLALPAAWREAAFATVFSVKEGIYKALNPATGVFLGFQDAAIEAPPSLDVSEGDLAWRLYRACGGAFPAGFRGQARFSLRGGYVLTAVWVEAAAD